MPKRQKPKVKSTTTVERLRGVDRPHHQAQLDRETINKLLTRTPWKKAKEKRYHSPDRVAKRNAWAKREPVAENTRGGKKVHNVKVSA